MSNRIPELVVPFELYPLAEEISGVHEDWQNVTLADIHRDIRDNPVEMVSIGDSKIGVVTLEPDTADRDEETDLALVLPHQQAWKPSMCIRARVLQQVVAPNSRLHVFPNNSLGQEYYDFNEGEMNELGQGSIRPLATKQMRALEAKGVHKAKISGYSLGGLCVIGMAEVGSDTIDITHINADEVPTQKGRSAKGVKKDFLKSGGWGEQRQAIKDSGIPVASQALSVGRLAADYARFGISSVMTENRLMVEAMSGSIEGLLAGALRDPSLVIKVGRAANSRMVDHTSIIDFYINPAQDRRIRYASYSGMGSHKHATGDNVFAHALMAKDGLRD